MTNGLRRLDRRRPRERRAGCKTSSLPMLAALLLLTCCAAPGAAQTFSSPTPLLAGGAVGSGAAPPPAAPQTLLTASPQPSPAQPPPAAAQPCQDPQPLQPPPAQGLSQAPGAPPGAPPPPASTLDASVAPQANGAQSGLASAGAPGPQVLSSHPGMGWLLGLLMGCQQPRTASDCPDMAGFAASQCMRRPCRSATISQLSFQPSVMLCKLSMLERQQPLSSSPSDRLTDAEATFGPGTTHWVRLHSPSERAVRWPASPPARPASRPWACTRCAWRGRSWRRL